MNLDTCIRASFCLIDNTLLLTIGSRQLRRDDLESCEREVVATGGMLECLKESLIKIAMMSLSYYTFQLFFHSLSLQ